MALTQVSTDGIKNGTISSADLGSNLKVTGSLFEVENTGGNANFEVTRVSGANFRIQSQASAVRLDTIGASHTMMLGTNGNGRLLISDSNIDLLNDNQKLRIGAGQDLSLYHDGINSYINNTTGTLFYLANTHYFTNPAVSEIQATFVKDGAVNLYFNGSKKFETTTNGVAVSNIQNNQGLDLNGVSNNTCIRFMSTGSSPNRGYRINFHSATNVFNAPALTFDRTATDGTFAAHLAGISDDGFHLTDNLKLHLGSTGSSGDLQIYHNGTNSFIENSTGILYIRDTSGGDVRIQGKSGEESIICNDDSSVDLYFDNSIRFNTNAAGVRFYGSLRGIDNEKLELGSSQDLQIYHDGSNSFIKDTGTGSLVVTSSTFAVNNAASTEQMMKAVENGAVELNYDGSKKFETTSGGGTLTGDWSVTNDFFWFDNGEAVFGSGGDLKIYHNGSNSYIDNGTGNLYFRGSNGQMLFRPNNNEDALVLKPNGAVELYYDNSKKFETTSEGVLIGNGGLHLGDNNYIEIGNSDDFQIFHDGTNSYVKTTNTNHNLILEGAHGVDIKHGGENMAKFRPDSYVELFYDNASKFETTSVGIKVNNRTEIRAGAILDNTAQGNNCGITFNGDGIRPCNGSGTEVNGQKDLGNASFRWRNVYTNDLDLSNEGGSNDVDGTWGSYTIQEGADDLFLINKRNGKKYKFNLTEIS